MQFWEAIVLLAAIGSIVFAFLIRTTTARDRARQAVQHDPEADRLREEVMTLKDRIAVLERLATDTNRAVDLDLAIEKLR